MTDALRALAPTVRRLTDRIDAHKADVEGRSKNLDGEVYFYVLKLIGWPEMEDLRSYIAGMVEGESNGPTEEYFAQLQERYEDLEPQSSGPWFRWEGR